MSGIQKKEHTRSVLDVERRLRRCDVSRWCSVAHIEVLAKGDSEDVRLHARSSFSRKSSLSLIKFRFTHAANTQQRSGVHRKTC